MAPNWAGCFQSLCQLSKTSLLVLERLHDFHTFASWSNRMLVQNVSNFSSNLRKISFDTKGLGNHEWSKNLDTAVFSWIETSISETGSDISIHAKASSWAAPWKSGQNSDWRCSERFKWLLICDIIIKYLQIPPPQTVTEPSWRQKRGNRAKFNVALSIRVSLIWSQPNMPIKWSWQVLQILQLGLWTLRSTDHPTHGTA